MTYTQTPSPLDAKTGPDLNRPRIYLACLAAYNNARLQGAWVAADLGEAHIWDRLRAMLAASPEPDAEEWAIHDYDGFEAASLSEHAGFDTVCDLAELIAEHGALGANLYTHFGNDLEDARAAFDTYCGSHESLAEFAETLTLETGPDIPDRFQFYIDWQAMGKDMELNGDIYAIETGFRELHLFWSQ